MAPGRASQGPLGARAPAAPVKFALLVVLAGFGARLRRGPDAGTTGAGARRDRRRSDDRRSLRRERAHRKRHPVHHRRARPALRPVARRTGRFRRASADLRARARPELRLVGRPSLADLSSPRGCPLERRRADHRRGRPLDLAGADLAGSRLELRGPEGRHHGRRGGRSAHRPVPLRGGLFHPAHRRDRRQDPPEARLEPGAVRRVAAERRLVSRPPGDQRPVPPGRLAAGRGVGAGAQRELFRPGTAEARPGDLPCRSRRRHAHRAAARRGARLRLWHHTARCGAHHEPERPARDRLRQPAVRLHRLEPAAGPLRRPGSPPRPDPRDRPAGPRGHAVQGLRPRRLLADPVEHLGARPAPSLPCRTIPPSPGAFSSGAVSPTATATGSSSATAGRSPSS